MELSLMITPANSIAALLTLIPLLGAAFFPQGAAGWARRLPAWAQLVCPAALSVPYVLVTCAAGIFRWDWFALYAVLPVAVASLLWQARRIDIGQRGNWRDFLVLASLGLAVDLRWFEGAWPAHLAIFNKILLLDACIYGFIVIRQLEGVGFDLRLRLRDATIGLRELAWYTPIALALGLSVDFLHPHRAWPGLAPMAGAWIFTFFFIAVPEELFFRGWLQNLLERRMGRTPALLLTAVLFGLSHFNKRTALFNWRYVLLAAVAGVFYGRAWRQERRVGTAAITHASVDTIWSLWLR
ncbi:MAG TPA: CPBP family intramembrane glutamic endopeptidase [Terracidiphilus sp.]|nr:CPBP family intramembrane glutamic endopeptidase [Terracidiphilus sp.]